jgi:hypothetical protein
MALELERRAFIAMLGGAAAATIVGIEWNVVSARNALAPQRRSAERGSGSLIIFKAVTGDHRDVIRSAILAAKPATPQFDPIKTLCSARRVPGYPAAHGARPFFSGRSMRRRAYH